MANKEEKEAKIKKNLIKGVRAELKKVTWLTPKQLVNNTTAVLIIVLILTVIVFVCDLIFKSASEAMVSQIEKSIVSTTVEDETETEIVVEDETETEIVVEDETETNDSEEVEVIEDESTVEE